MVGTSGYGAKLAGATCPLRLLRNLPSRAFHSLVALSHPALAIIVPSGENWTWFTLFWWPSYDGTISNTICFRRGSRATYQSSNGLVGVVGKVPQVHGEIIASTTVSGIRGQHRRPHLLAETKRSATLPLILTAFSNRSFAFCLLPSSVSGISLVWSKYPVWSAWSLDRAMWLIQ
jgi:hypothetical protein